MEMIRLRNGSEEAEPVVRATMMSFNRLIDTNPIVAYELVMKCRDNDHQFFGRTGDDLKLLSLIDANGGVHDSVRNIILSAAKGEGLKMLFISPIAD